MHTCGYQKLFTHLATLSVPFCIVNSVSFVIWLGVTKISKQLLETFPVKGDLIVVALCSRQPFIRVVKARAAGGTVSNQRFIIISITQRLFYSRGMLV